MLKKLLKTIGILIVLLLILILGFFWRDSVSDKYDISIEDEKIPRFEQVDLAFEHSYNSEKSLPIAPSSLTGQNHTFLKI